MMTFVGWKVWGFPGAVASAFATFGPACAIYFAAYRVSDPTIMGFLRNNSMFTFGKADRARASVTFAEILEAMWLFNEKFERALAKFNEVKAQ